MRKTLLAIDVGGSTSRAYLVDETGQCLGHGRDRGGNPASNNPDFAADSIISAVDAAVADAGGGPLDIVVAQIALAGPQVRVALAKLEAAFRAHGLSGPVVFTGDLLAMFASVTAATEGYGVVAGTGAGAVRVRAGSIERVVDAAGWLLGDLGSGYWLGHEAAKAVCADLEGRGATTALTPALLAALGIASDDPAHIYGRPAPLRLFIDGIYALRPIELARFAPLVFANRSDAVAAALIAQAATYIVTDFANVFDAEMPGPIAMGGGIIAHLAGAADGIAEVVRAAGHVPDIRMVGEGSVGAVVLALRAVGISVDEAMVSAIGASIAARNGGRSRPV